MPYKFNPLTGQLDYYESASDPSIEPDNFSYKKLDGVIIPQDQQMIVEGEVTNDTEVEVSGEVVFANFTDTMPAFKTVRYAKTIMQDQQWTLDGELEIIGELTVKGEIVIAGADAEDGIIYRIIEQGEEKRIKSNAQWAINGELDLRGELVILGELVVFGSDEDGQVPYIVRTWHHIKKDRQMLLSGELLIKGELLIEGELSAI